MALQFSCPQCGEQVISRLLMPGIVTQCPHCQREVEIPQSAQTVDDRDVPAVIRQESPVEARPSQVTAVDSERGDTVSAFLGILGWISITGGVAVTLYLLAKIDNSMFSNTTAMVVVILIGFIFVILGTISIGVSAAIQRLIR